MDVNGAKGICIVILLVLALAFGCVPVWLYNRGILTATGSYRRKLVLDIISCFAGGVFLSTCLIHILAEGREEFETYKEEVHFDNDFPFFEAVAGIGLFLVAIVEKIGFAIMSGSKKDQRKDKHNSSNGTRASDPPSLESYRGYGSRVQLEPGNQNALHAKTAVEFTNQALTSNELEETGYVPDKIVSHVRENAVADVRQPGTVSGGDKEDGTDTTDGRENHHGATSCPSSDITKLSMVRSVLLMLALSFHSVFDGLAVGLQTSASEVWEVLVAIAIHKALVAFCLGLELAAAAAGRLTQPLTLVVLFAIISPIGIGIGMGVTSSSVDELAKLLVSSILQAIAAGTFLYVTFFEILGQHFSHTGSADESLCVGFGKVAAAVIGFASMSSVKLLEKD